MSKFLAVPKDDPLSAYLEDNDSAVKHALTAGVAITHYRLTFDEFDRPIIKAEPVTLREFYGQ